MSRQPPVSPLFPYTPFLHPSEARRTVREGLGADCDGAAVVGERLRFWSVLAEEEHRAVTADVAEAPLPVRVAAADLGAAVEDRKSTRLNSSHANISYAVFCL